MAQIFIESKWNTIMCELEGIVDKEVNNPTRESLNTIEGVFDHYINLYFHYIMIAQGVEECYDAMVHPQKRDDIKEIMTLVICRIIDLRHHIVKWNPSCVDLQKKSGGKSNEPFPWEYIDMHKYMTNMKIRPHRLDTPIPSFFKVEDSQKRKERNALVEGYMQLKLSITTLPLQDHRYIEKEEDNKEEVALGPKSKVINAFDASFRESNVRRDKCTVMIQRIVRGYLVRRDIERKLEKEQIFIGMHQPYNDGRNDKLKQHLDDMCLLRKQGQLEIDEEYRDALVALKGLVKQENEFDMKQSLMKERVEWVTEQIAKTNNIPETLDDFYKNKNTCVSDNQIMDSTVNEKEKTSDSKEKPAVTNPDQLLVSINKRLLKYKEIWNQNEEKKCKSQGYNEDVAKNLVVKDEVYEEARKIVDTLLLKNLCRIKALQSNGSGKAGGKKGGDKKKKGKASKGKKGKGKGKGKGKALPGDKIPSLKSMDTGHMLSVLVENKLINHVEDMSLNDFIGSDLPASFNANESGTESRPTSSISQIRNMITEYCILPQGSKRVVDNIDEKHDVRSMLLYGAEKSGKTAYVQAIANHLGALFINLSPNNIPEKFLTEKSGTTKLVHMAFSVAKDPKFAPVVIYLDECEIYFQSSKKKKKANAALKLQKDLLIYKNQFLSKNDRVLVVGCSRRPMDAELKTIKWKGPSGKPEKQGFFERSIHVPCPSHSDRISLWKTFIEEKMKNRKERQLNYSLMSQVSEGYSAGMIKACVDKILTIERIRLNREVLREEEFIEELKQLFKSVEQDEQSCHKFTDAFYSKKVDKPKKKSKKKK